MGAHHAHQGNNDDLSLGMCGQYLRHHKVRNHKSHRAHQQERLASDAIDQCHADERHYQIGKSNKNLSIMRLHSVAVCLNILALGVDYGKKIRCVR
jgi:hypothetical protein